MRLYGVASADVRATLAMPLVESATSAATRVSSAGPLTGAVSLWLSPGMIPTS